MLTLVIRSLCQKGYTYFEIFLGRGDDHTLSRGIKVHSIVTINDIIDAIENGVVPGIEHLEKMKQYREEYGVK